MDVYPVSWTAADSGPGDTCRVTAYGKTPDGKSACVHIRFTPFFFVELPPAWNEARGKLFVVETAQRFKCDPGKSRIVRRSSIWGYTGGKTALFALLAFDSIASHRRARYALRKEYATFEASVDPVVRLFHLRDLAPCRWFRVSAYTRPHKLVALVDEEVECALAAIGPSPVTTRPPLVLASWDLECFSATGKFPVADNPHDYLIQISTTFQRYGEPEPYAREVVCLRDTDAVEGVTIVSCEQEHEVINAWARTLREHGVDVLLGYNTWQFDFRYLAGRAGVLVDDDTADPLVELDLLGRAFEGGGETREFELNSGAYGQNKFFVLDTPGVQQLDLLQIMRRETRLPSYSLDNVSKHFLGSQKLDLPAAEIFRKFQGSSADRADIARYAVRDTELPLQLLAKLSLWENLSEMANAVRVPMDYLLSRGQQIKVFSTLLGKARQMGFLIPDDRAIGVPEGVKYEGAVVLHAERGAHMDVVSALDYASLASCWQAADDPQLLASC